MKKIFCILISAAFLTGCAATYNLSRMASDKMTPDSGSSWNDRSSYIDKTSNKNHAATNPDDVQLFMGGEKPSRRYEKLGMLTVSTDNSWGMSRSEADIRINMKERAASVGGDAVINVQRGLTTMTGTIIRYTKR